MGKYDACSVDDIELGLTSTLLGFSVEMANMEKRIDYVRNQLGAHVNVVQSKRLLDLSRVAKKAKKLVLEDLDYLMPKQAVALKLVEQK